jgi:hypothetical protein
MKAITLVKATMSYKLGQVKMTKTNGGVLLTAGKDGDPITCSDIVTAASVIGMIVYFSNNTIFIGDQYEQKNPKP